MSSSALTKSSFMKIVISCKHTAKLYKCGIGYLSGTVIAFIFLKSPQGYHTPVSGFWTMCSSEKYGLLEGRMMPNCKICWNSAFAILYFSGRNLRGDAYIGGSVTLCRWSAKQTIPLSVLARNQTKGFGLVEKRKISYFGLARNLIQHWISANQDDLSYSARTFISG